MQTDFDFYEQDLKPNNIGLSLNPDNTIKDVKILDFGLARKLDADMTQNVVTQWYRAPEVFLQPGNYSKAGKLRKNILI